MSQPNNWLTIEKTISLLLTRFILTSVPDNFLLNQHTVWCGNLFAATATFMIGFY